MFRDSVVRIKRFCTANLSSSARLEVQKQSFLFSWDSKWPPCDKGLLERSPKKKPGLQRLLSFFSSDHHVRFCHDPLSHLVIDASSCMKLLHTRRDYKLCTFSSCFVFSCRQFGNLHLPLFGVKYVNIDRMNRSITIF